MGYRTWVTMEVKDSGTMTKKETRKAFKELCEKAELMSEELNLEDLQTAGEDNNGNSLDTFIEESKKYPELLLEGSVDGTTEDSEDQRKVRIRGGQIETVMVKLTYEPFEKLLTAQEKRNEKPFLQQLNRIEIIGEVGRICTQKVGDATSIHLSVATDYLYKDRSGRPVMETTWHNVMGWQDGNHVDITNLEKGDNVHVLGRLRTRDYVDANGEKKTFYEVMANRIVKIDTKVDDEN